MDEKPSNIYKPKASGMFIAALLLVLVIIVAVVVVVVLVNRNDGSKKPAISTVTTEATTVITTASTTTVTTTKQDDTPDPGDDDRPTVNKTSVPTDDVYKGALIFIDSDNTYKKDKNLLIGRSAMAKLTAKKLLVDYNFKNVYGTTDGNYKVVSDTGYYLDAGALDAFNAMMSAYVAEKGNKDVQLRNAYYYDASEESDGGVCYNATGLVVDLQILTTQTVAGEEKDVKYPLNYIHKKADYYDWFISNCYKYGFIHLRNAVNSAGEQSYSSFRFVGVANAAVMNAKSLTHEDYIDFIKAYSFENRLVLSSGGVEWWIYYVAGTGDTTEISVVGNDYTVYGNNIDGFVVAVNASALG